MKKIITIFAINFILISTVVSAQTNLKEYKIGHIITISLPDYMSKTTGLNTSASIQYKNSVKDVYGMIIEDTKEELALAELNYSSINEFYEGFVKDFLIDEEKRNISKPEYQTKGDDNFIEFDASYFDKESKIEIYYLVGIVETKTSFYKILSWTGIENKEKYKADFQKILYSLKD